MLKKINNKVTIKYAIAANFAYMTQLICHSDNILTPISSSLTAKFCSSNEPRKKYLVAQSIENKKASLKKKILSKVFKNKIFHVHLIKRLADKNLYEICIHTCRFNYYHYRQDIVLDNKFGITF